MKSSRRRLVGTGLAIAALPLAGLATLAPEASAVSTRVAVAPAVRPLALSHHVALPPTAQFDVVLTPRHASQLRTLLADVANPLSSSYRHFLTPSEYAAAFAPRRAVTQHVVSYFRHFGLVVRTTPRAPLLLQVAGPSSRVAELFAAPLTATRVGSGPVTTSFARAATLPADIAHAVTAIDGFSSLRHPAPLRVTSRPSLRSRFLRSHNNPTLPKSCQGAVDAQTGNSSFVVSQQAQAYGIDQMWAKGVTGAGQTIAVYELAKFNASDVHTFFTCYGLTNTLTVVNVDGGPRPADNAGGATEEANLDIEEAAALAPGAHIVVYQGTQTTSTGSLDTYQAIASANVAGVVTTSWGGCEGIGVSSGDIHAETVIFQQMSLQGQTTFAAAGDNGSSDCLDPSNQTGTEQLAVDDPASQPTVTGVGGLTIDSLASTTPPATLSETVWNSGQNGGSSGGGYSSVWTQPSWQVGPGISTTTGPRMVPDLSVMGDPNTGFIDYSGGSWGSIGGTSIGSPIMSAIAATAEQACGSRLGNLNPTLYAMAAAHTGFDDVTTGNNSIFSATHNHYVAGTGYDPVSGLGSPHPSTFISDLCSLAASAATTTANVSPTSNPDLAVGATVTLTVRDAANHPLKFVTPTVQATQSGATPTVTALSPTTNAAGDLTYVVNTVQPGTVHLTFSVSTTQVATATAIFSSSVASSATTFARLGAAPGQLATSSSATSLVGVAVTPTHQVTEGLSVGNSVNNLSTRLHLGAAQGAPALDCASSSHCVAAVDIHGALGVLTSVTSSSPGFTNVGAPFVGARTVRPGTLAVRDGGSAGYLTVTYVSTAGHLWLAQWRASTHAYVVTDLSARFHLGAVTSTPALVTSGAGQSFVAARVGPTLWMVRFGVLNSAANVAAGSKYATTGAGALTSAPQLLRDSTRHGQLVLLAHTGAGRLVAFDTTPGATSTFTSWRALVNSGVTADAFVAGPVGAGPSPDILILKGSSIFLGVDGPHWFILPVGPLLSGPLAATGLTGGTSPLATTSTTVVSIVP